MVELYDNTPPENASITIRVFPAAASASLSATGSTTKVVRNPTSQFVTSTNTVDPALIPFGSTAPGPFSGLMLNPAAPSPNITVTTNASTTASSGSFSQSAVQYTRFLSYELFEDYLTPAAAGNFSLAADELSDSGRNALLPGSRVEVSIGDQVQIIGYIDDIRSFGNHSSGSVWTIEFRDWLSSAVDAHIDPQTRVKPNDTFEQAVIKILGPFGVTVIAEDAIANRNAITGAIYGTPTTKSGKPSKRAISHECKPYPAEGALAFASRITQRAGLWIRPAVDGKTAIVAAPDFEQPSRYAIRLKTDGSGRNNVTDWDVRKSRLDQPSMIFGVGFGGGGEWPKSTLRGAIINPLIALANDNIVAQLLSAYPGLVGTTPPAPAIVSAIASIMLDPNARPLYLYDSESKTADELRAYLRRELALRMRKSLVAQYTIEGHTLGGQPIAVDTMMDVEDDIAGINGPLWVLSRRFTKVSGEQGTKTQVHLIRPGTLLF